MAKQTIDPTTFMAGEITYSVLSNVSVGDCTLQELVEDYGEQHWQEMVADAARQAVSAILGTYTVKQKSAKQIKEAMNQR